MLISPIYLYNILSYIMFLKVFSIIYLASIFILATLVLKLFLYPIIY